MNTKQKHNPYHLCAINNVVTQVFNKNTFHDLSTMDLLLTFICTAAVAELETCTIFKLKMTIYYPIGERYKYMKKQIYSKFIYNSYVSIVFSLHSRRFRM